MKQYNFNSSPHCNSIKSQKNENFIGTHVIVTPQSITRCTGNCFQKSFYQCTSHMKNPSNISSSYYPMSFIGNPPFHQPSHLKTINTKQKSLDPSSYRVTVRRITPSHVAAAAAEIYRSHKNKDSNRNYLNQFNKTLINNQQQFKTTPISNIYEKGHLNCNNQNTPSVPSKKIIFINKGIQVSSASFITTTDDQKSFSNDTISEKNFEPYRTNAQTFDELSSSNSILISSKFNSTLPNINVINNELPLDQIPMNISEDIVTKNDIDDISNKKSITEQIELIDVNVIEEYSSVQSQPIIDKAERQE